jgi:hypothetical protein
MGWRKSAVNGNASSHAQPNTVPNEDGDEQEDKEDPNSPSQDRETPQDCAGNISSFFTLYKTYAAGDQQQDPDSPFKDGR